MRDQFMEVWDALGGATKAMIAIGAAIGLCLSAIRPCADGMSPEERARINAQRKVDHIAIE